MNRVRVSRILRLCFGVACLFPLSAGAAQKEKIAVLDLASENAGPTSALTDVLTAEIGRCGYGVMSKSDIEAMLDLETMKDVMGCNEVSCMAELGGALGVKHLVSGVVAKVGASYLVTLKLINTKRAAVENRITMKWAGKPVGLSALVAAAAQELMLPVKERPPGTVKLSQLPKGAAVYIDEKPVTLTDDTVANLQLGPHSLKVTAKHHHDLKTNFVLLRGQQLHLDAALKAIRRPLYTRWWFWTSLAAVLAGGVTITVVLLQGRNKASGQINIPSIFSLTSANVR